MQQYIYRYAYKNGCIKQCGEKDIIYIHEAEDDGLLYKAHKTCTVTLRHLLLYEVYGYKTGHIFVYEDLRHKPRTLAASSAEIHRARIHAYNIHSAKAQPFSVYDYHIRV